MYLFDCPVCYTRKYYLFAGLFYAIVIPAIISVFVLYVKSKAVLLAQQGQQIANRKATLKDCLLVIKNEGTKVKAFHYDEG